MPQHQGRKDCQYHGGNHNNRRIIPGKTGDEILHLRFLTAGILHQLQDLGNRGIIKFLCDLYPEQPAPVDTAADDIVTHAGLPWDRLPGKGRGIHHGIPKYHPAVQRNPLPGFYHDDIAHLHVIRVHLLKLSVLLYVGVFRTDVHKLRDGLPGAVHRITLEQFAHLIEQHDCHCLRIFPYSECAKGGYCHEKILIKNLAVLNVSECFVYNIPTNQHIGNQIYCQPAPDTWSCGQRTHMVRHSQRDIYNECSYDTEKHCLLFLCHNDFLS